MTAAIPEIDAISPARFEREYVRNGTPCVLGVPTPDGLQFIDKPLPITDEFREIARQGRDPGRRFRFTSPCKERGCPQWNEGAAGGGRCGVSDAVTEELGPVVTTKADWEGCPIRDRCQWRVQSGDDACRVCTEVITNLFVEEKVA